MLTANAAADPTALLGAVCQETRAQPLPWGTSTDALCIPDCPQSGMECRGNRGKTLLSWFFPFNSGLSAYLAVIWKNSEGWYLRALPYCCSLHFGTYFQCLANSPLTQLNAHPGKTECMGIYRKEM